MNYQKPPISQQTRLYNAINECDKLRVLCEHHNDAERSQSHVGYRGASLRLMRHSKMGQAILEHRQNLHALYVETYGVDPWANVPF